MTDLPEYMSDGPWLPGEDAHTAMGENTAHALTSHMIRRARGGVNYAQHVPAQGGAYDPAPLSHAQAAATIRGALRPGSNPAPADDSDDEMEILHSPYDHEEAVAQDPHERFEPVAARLRSGGSTANPASRAPQSPRTRRGPGGSSRPQ